MEKKEILRDKNKKAPKTESVLDGIFVRAPTLADEFPALVFAMYDFGHLFRRFPAAAFQPFFYDGIQAGLKKLHMIGDVFVAKVCFGLPRIIELYFVLAVIAQFEIGFVEKLIALDVIKQAQVVVAVHLIIPIVLIKLGHIRFQLFPDRVCKRIEICIVGVKGAPIQLTL